MQTLKWILLAGLTAYGAIVAFLYLQQRSLMYFPEAQRTLPQQAGLAQASEVPLTASDGEHVLAWHIPPREGAPVILYFHGNGGALRYRAERFTALTADGAGLLALSYRGYGGSTGMPSEAGLIRDAQAAYAFAAERYRPAQLVLWGESLGSGVAVALAATREVAKVILESPFTSTAAIAAATYPFVPVRWLMLDQFRSDERIGNVRAPVLVMHGDRDATVPIAYGENLYAMIQSPKRFVRFAGGGHGNLDGFGAVKAARAFIEQP